MCTLKADLSGLQSSLRSYAAAKGRGQYWRIEYEVEVFFGQTSLCAGLVWKERVRSSPSDLRQKLTMLAGPNTQGPSAASEEREKADERTLTGTGFRHSELDRLSPQDTSPPSTPILFHFLP